MMLPSRADLEGRVVVVTGAARGMGRAHVEAFLEARARVVAADISWEGVKDFRTSLDANPNVMALDMDITNDAQIDAAYTATLNAFGTTDVLVNNAALLNLGGTRPQATTLETLDEDWPRIFGVNVFGTVKVIRRFIQPMINKRRGSIIIVVSSGLLNFAHGGGFKALRPHTREMPYMASKAAVANMGFYLASEVQPDNVAVNMIMPGYSTHGWFVERMRVRLGQGRPPGQRPVKPEHAVPIVQYLATQDASGVTGTLFDVITWNQEHGLGGYDDWLDYGLPPDIEEAFSQSERIALPVEGYHGAPTR
jgi:NAD(P)-dependent dehydrogenase (short-subunit alcohol dehydrogenase family)